jgi:hypothetical protein
VKRLTAALEREQLKRSAAEQRAEQLALEVEALRSECASLRGEGQRRASTSW